MNTRLLGYALISALSCEWATACGGDDDDDDGSGGCAHAQMVCADESATKSATEWEAEREQEGEERVRIRVRGEVDCDEWDEAPASVQDCADEAATCDAVLDCLLGSD